MSKATPLEDILIKENWSQGEVDGILRVVGSMKDSYAVGVQGALIIDTLRQIKSLTNRVKELEDAR